MTELEKLRYEYAKATARYQKYIRENGIPENNSGGVDLHGANVNVMEVWHIQTAMLQARKRLHDYL